MKLRTVKRTLLVLTAMCALILGSARAADWPQFGGPERDGVSPEKGLLKSWPKDGPPRLWQAKDIGGGWASFSVVGGRVYTTGVFAGDLSVVAIEPGGKVAWRRRIDAPTAAMGFKGARCTPTVDGDRLYVLSDAGTAVCLKRDSGEIVWSENLLKKYKASNNRHSLAESPLVDGDRVIFTVGGRASMVALDKTSGKEVWATERVDDGAAGYASAQLIEYKGLRQIVSLTEKNIFGVHADTGKLLWKHPRPTPWGININSPHVLGGVIFVTCGYKRGTEALRLHVEGQSARVTRLWNAPELDDFMGGLALVPPLLVGTCHEQKPGLVALDIRTGKTVYKNTKISEASIIRAEGLLYVVQYDGTVCLVNPAKGSVISRFRIPVKHNERTKMWTHAVISDGLLYLRHDSTLSVYDIRAK